MTAQKQEFLGGLIGGILIKKGVEFAIDKAIDKVAKSPSLSLEKKDASAVKEIVKVEVEKEVQARVEHQTNNEPVYQSRVAQGSSAAVLMAVATLWQFWTDSIAQGPMEYTPPALVVVGGLWALYGRFIAKKPLGR
jgi:hypothetical protein